MNEMIAHSSYGFPGDIWMFESKIIGKTLGSFSNDCQLVRVRLIVFLYHE